MAYNQNNPLSRKSSPCSREESLSEIRKKPGSSNAGKYPDVKEFCGPAGGAAKGTYPVNTPERIASAKKLAHNAPNPEGIKACADRAAKKEGVSRKSSSPLNADMTIVDEEKGEGESNYKAKQGDKKGVPTSRKSSSPLNRTGWGAWELKYNAIDDITQGHGEADYGMSRHTWGHNKDEYKRHMVDGVEKKTGVVDHHYKDYEGPSRKSSSPANFGSWAHKDAVRAKKLYKEGDWAHAHDLGIDEHDADYAKHWHKDEAEHGPSRHVPGHISEKDLDLTGSTSMHTGDKPSPKLNSGDMSLEPHDKDYEEKKMMMIKKLKPIKKIKETIRHNPMQKKRMMMTKDFKPIEKETRYKPFKKLKRG